jgi:hypothetical protein
MENLNSSNELSDKWVIFLQKQFEPSQDFKTGALNRSEGTGPALKFKLFRCVWVPYFPSTFLTNSTKRVIFIPGAF